MSKINTFDKKKILRLALVMFFTGLFIGAFIYLKTAL
jgi:hypothetical protein